MARGALLTGPAAIPIRLDVDREQALGYGLVAVLVAAWWFFSLSPAILIGVGGLLGILGRHAGA